MALSPDLASWLRSLGHDAVHAADLQLNRASDTQILLKALDEARVVITALLGAGAPGLVLLRGGNYSEAESLECVRRVLMAIAMEELPKSIVVVDRKSIRLRNRDYSREHRHRRTDQPDACGPHAVEHFNTPWRFSIRFRYHHPPVYRLARNNALSGTIIFILLR